MRFRAPKDNWDFSKSDGKWEIMEGGGPKGCKNAFIIICLVPIASAAGIVWWFL